jgi:hypothetical protein
MKRWWDEVVKEHELEPHEMHLLRLACQAWDRCEQARKAIAEHGTTYEDRFDAPRTRPEVAIERDSRQAFARLLKDLGLRAPSPLWSNLSDTGGMISGVRAGGNSVLGEKKVCGGVRKSARGPRAVAAPKRSRKLIPLPDGRRRPWLGRRARGGAQRPAPEGVLAAGEDRGRISFLAHRERSSGGAVDLLRRDILLADDDLVALIKFAATVFFDRNVLDRCSMR